jgi:hypothetical protein
VDEKKKVNMLLLALFHLKEGVDNSLFSVRLALFDGAEFIDAKLHIKTSFKP